MRLAVIDDHPLIRDAVLTLVASLPGEHAVLGFGSLEGFDAAVADEPCSLVLLDLGLPGFTGLEALVRYRAAHEDTPVVVLSALSDRDTILAALDLGAMGFIPKTSKREVLIGAIELVASGGIYVPPEAIARPASNPTSSPAEIRRRPNATTDRMRRARNLESSLTQRQRDVLNLLIRGLPNKLICRQLELSPNTVKSHLSAIFRVLDVTNRTQAVIAAQQLGMRVDYGV